MDLRTADGFIGGQFFSFSRVMTIRLSRPSERSGCPVWRWVDRSFSDIASFKIDIRLSRQQVQCIPARDTCQQEASRSDAVLHNRL